MITVTFRHEIMSLNYVDKFQFHSLLRRKHYGTCFNARKELRALDFYIGVSSRRD